ncbi:hypothetical protein BOX15_Mlig031297g1 [Macrostomum lignano]|uniref:Biotin-protein ligase N-terminal domain-containing protein n=2 Tax=Macrostomum lignano TaxID=282301 RepID=A0A267F7G1_9PLAT|nr:hypothetical protein BOX15_Mlig031297g1 [Macrostomum lignano]
MMISALVYTGEGADAEAREDLLSFLTDYFANRRRECRIETTADAAEFQDLTALGRFQLIAFPGGFDLGFVRRLGAAGMANLARRVRSGSCGYLGMCAGAYFACREIEFAKGDPELEVLGSRLGLYRGLAVGPVFPGFDYKSLAGARVVENATVFEGDNKVHVYFNGGPKFVPDNQDPAAAAADSAEVLARYTEEEAAGQPAVVLAKCGLGGALLFGCHPEMDKKQLESSSDPRLREIFAQLSRGAEDRRQATYRMLDELMKIVDAAGH